MSQDAVTTSRQTRLLLTLGLVVVLGLFVLNSYGLGPDVLPFGRSPTWPTGSVMSYYGMWSFFMLLGIVLLTRLLASTSTVEQAQAALLAIPSRYFLWGGTLLAFCITALIRLLVLEEAPVTDDESPYEFSARLLASGRLVGQSPPMKLFFDRSFMINDGTWYSQYFLGWPALMVPFVWLGLPGYANSFYCAATVPLLFKVAERFVGSSWARLCILLYLSSPMLMMGAATGMSHTTCFFALTLLCYSVGLAADAPDRPIYSAAVAASFCLAFFIRPLTAVGLGAPALIAWLLAVRRSPAWPRSILAFALVAVSGGGLFLLINFQQNGDPFLVAYQRIHQYVADNGYRFTHFKPLPPDKPFVANMRLGEPQKGLNSISSALFRLNYVLFGWPCSLLPTLLAPKRKLLGWLWAAVAFFCACNIFGADAGVDAFGPVHFFELSLPLLLLTVAGLRHVTRLLQQQRRLAWHRLPVTVAAAATFMGGLTYGLPRLHAASRIAENVNAARLLPERAGLQKAVVFSSIPFVRYCMSHPARGWVFWRPDNGPDWQQQSVTWVNHVTQEADHELMAKVFPDRTGYVMLWTKNCVPRLIPLTSIPPGELPPGLQRSTGPQEMGPKAGAVMEVPPTDLPEASSVAPTSSRGSTTAAHPGTVGPGRRGLRAGEGR